MAVGVALDVVLGSGVLEASHVMLQGAGSVDQQSLDPAARRRQTAVLTLLVGAVLIAARPVYVNRVVRDVRDEPIACFAWGIVTLVVFGFLIWALVITRIGVLVAIPLLFVFAVLAAGGNVLAYLALLEEAVGNRWVALAVAVCSVFFVSLIGVVGTIVNFLVASAGMGAMVRRWLD